MLNTTLFEICFYVYAFALILSIAALVNRKPLVEKGSFWLFVGGFALHTVALLVRWAEAGDVEVAAFEETEGRVLQGWEWFHVWISHPPWSNLYESLVCFGWGASLVSIYGIWKFKIRILPVFAIGLSLVVMGAASLLINQEITPLVPALQSKWIHLHVTMATICYPAFGLAAILALFYLMKEGVKTESFGVALAAASLLFILAVGGESLLLNGEYGMTLLGEHQGQSYPLTFVAFDANNQALGESESFRLPFKLAGVWMMLSMASFLAFVVAYALNMQSRKLFNGLMLSGFLFLTILIAQIVLSTSGGETIQLTDQQIRGVVESRFAEGVVAGYQLHGQAPFSRGLSANPFEFILLITAWLHGILYFLLAWKRDWLVSELPDSEKLDDLSYKTILFAFPFLTLLIVTGAIWAYYAWGRYWGWDPKETWSLVTWIVYAIYLHVRFTHGWEGKMPAVIATIGFGVVIFTYLGVNILISGLHSYATG